MGNTEQLKFHPSNKVVSNDKYGGSSLHFLNSSNTILELSQQKPSHASKGFSFPAFLPLLLAVSIVHVGTKDTGLLVFHLDNLSIYCLRKVQTYCLKEAPIFNNVLKNQIAFIERKRILDELP